MDPRLGDNVAPSSETPAPLYEYDPDFSNGKWFPNWKPFQGDLDQHSVAINDITGWQSVMLGVHTAMFMQPY